MDSAPIAGGGLPYFKSPDKLPRVIPKPSGNFVKLRCVAEGTGMGIFCMLLHMNMSNLLDFCCDFVGTPDPNITWTKDGSEINRSFGKVSYQKWGVVLEDLTPRDSGIYTCKVCNIHGCIEHNTMLKVQG